MSAPTHIAFRNAIIKELDKATISRRPSQVFEEWVSLVHASLRELPRQLASAVEQKPHEDLPETRTVFDRMRALYREQELAHLSRATGILLESVETDYMDVLGLVYMEWGHPSKGQGQFFTPFHVASMMAQITAGESLEKQVHERLKDAIGKSITAQAMLLASLTIDDPAEALAWYLARVVQPALEHYDPIAVNDPCCGSGIMFLAVASSIPWWMTQLGLVQFYGQDVDGLCVQMAQCNSMLYGLNGRYAPLIFAQMEQRQGVAAQPADSDPGAAAEAGTRQTLDPRLASVASPPLQEKPGWNPGDYIQQTLFSGEDSATREPAPAYSAAGPGGIRDARRADYSVSRLADSGLRRRPLFRGDGPQHYHSRQAAAADVTLRTTAGQMAFRSHSAGGRVS